MKRNVVETVLGAVVLAAAFVFLVFSYSTANVGSVSGYELSANFSSIGGLAVGDDVVISGVKVGTVSHVDLDPNTYLARVSMSVDPSVRLPDDTAALISSESLLGGKYLALEPGASEDILPPGGRIQYTQAPQNLEQLLGQFIFSMQKDDKAAPETAAASTPAPAPTFAPAAPMQLPPVEKHQPAEETPVEEPAHP
jgi:phospholipid/cholesterol/gamma-HCH transport system substrate-binding protein